MARDCSRSKNIEPDVKRGKQSTREKVQKIVEEVKPLELEEVEDETSLEEETLVLTEETPKWF